MRESARAARTTLIRHARVWPSAGAAPIEDGSLLVRDGRIAAVGRRVHARPDVVLDAGGALLIPGFVQTHVHLCQALFRGAAEDCALLPWLRGFVWPLEAAHDPESLRVSALLACAELIRGGTTTICSFETVRHTAAVFEAAASTGISGLISHCFMDETGGYEPLAVPVEEALAECEVLRRRLEPADRLGLAVAPRFALSSSRANLRTVVEYARDRRLPLHTHCAEQVQEVEWVRERTGLDNFDYLHRLGLSGPDVLLAHCVHLSPGEQRLLAETGTRVLHCPSTNLKLGSGIAPVPEYLERGVCVSLGADGAPCNNRLDMFTEMRTAGLVQKLRRGPEALAAREVFRMATEGGARALGLERELGTLEVGKRANLLLVGVDGFHVLPSEDPAATLVYACTGADVELVMADGRILFEDGRLAAIDEESLRREARAQRRKLFRRAGLG
jgi:5-methylthioadenosine/S-adenosylhomocysteine deaminase